MTTTTLRHTKTYRHTLHAFMVKTPDDSACELCGARFKRLQVESNASKDSAQILDS